MRTHGCWSGCPTLHQPVSEELDFVFTYSNLALENITYRSPLGKSHHLPLEMNYTAKEEMFKDKTPKIGETIEKTKDLNTYFHTDWEDEIQNLGIL